MNKYIQANDKIIISQSEIYQLVQSEKDKDKQIIINYLEEVALSFKLDDVFNMIAYVDTPDVLG